MAAKTVNFSNTSAFQAVHSVLFYYVSMTEPWKGFCHRRDENIHLSFHPAPCVASWSWDQHRFLPIPPHGSDLCTTQRMRKCQLEPARSGQASVPASLVPGCWVNSWFLTVSNAPHVFPVVFQTSSGTAAPAAEQDPFPEPLFGLAPGNDLNLAAFN